MKFARLFLLFCLIGASAVAENALYVVKLKSTKTFELVANPAAPLNWLNFYPFSEQMASVAHTGTRNVIGADYDSGIKIKTQQPKIALQEILSQIREQTGLMLKLHINTNLSKIEPAAVLQGFSETATITLILTPKEEGAFILSYAYLFEKKPEGSIDGTPAGIAQMEEERRKITAFMSADSAAKTLPGKFADKDLKPEDFFRGRQEFAITDPSGKKSTAVVFLVLKTGRDHTVGFYQKNADTWTMIDQPVELKETRSPHIFGTTNGKDNFLSIRAVNADGIGGVDLYVDEGRIIKKAVTEKPKD